MKTQTSFLAKNQTPALHPGWLGASGKFSPSHWAAMLAVVILLSTIGIAGAQAPRAINYQGKLMNNDGSPVATGYYTVWFRIWSSLNDSTTSGYIWGRSFPVNVSTGGLFNVLLDDNGSQVNNPGAPRYTNLLSVFDEPNRYLGLSIAAVNGTTVSPVKEISPRQQLVSAPYAIHSSTATRADSASLADYAVLATNSYYAATATNANNFGGMTTNDYIRAKAAGQVLTGTLSVTEGLYATNLTVQGETILSGFSSAQNTFAASKDLNVYGLLRANGGMSGGGTFSWGGGSPIMIRQYPINDIPPTQYVPVLYDTTVSATEWTAVIAGFRFDGNVADANIRSPMWQVQMASHLGRWHVVFFVFPEQALTNIKVDVMFIRREFASDNRPSI